MLITPQETSRPHKSDGSPETNSYPGEERTAEMKKEDLNNEAVSDETDDDAATVYAGASPAPANHTQPRRRGRPKQQNPQ
jgi:hypothetical protein